MSLLGDPPAGLAPLPRAFFAQLDALLDALDPPLLDPGMTKASARGDGLEVVLAHGRDLRCSTWAHARPDGVTVGCAATVQELDAAAALRRIAQLLCGEAEVRGHDGARLRPDFGAGRCWEDPV